MTTRKTSSSNKSTTPKTRRKVRQPKPEIEVIIDDDLELIDYEEVKPKRKRRKKSPEFDINQTKQIVKTGFKAGEAVADLVFDILAIFW